MAATVSGAEMTTETLLDAYVEKIDQRHAVVTEALQQFKKRQFSEARNLLKKANQADPQLPPAGILLTRMFIAASQPELARSELERVVEQHPDDPEGFLGIGEVAVQERRFADAELALSKVTDLIKAKSLTEFRKKKMIQRWRLAMADVAEHRKDWSSLIEHLQPIVDENISQPKIVLALARSRFRLGQQEAAFELLQKHWQSDPVNVRRPEITIAQLFQEDGNTAKATQSMRLAAKSDPKNEATQLFVATWALEQGDFKLADACANQALKISDGSIQSRLLVALVDRYQQDYQSSMKVLESVHLESPANLAALIELAIVMINIEGMESRALEYAQLATKVQPNLQTPAGRNAAMTLAWVLNQFGGRVQAEEIVRQVLAAGSLGLESSYFAAKIILPGKNRSAAKQLLKAALDSKRIFPGHEDAKKIYENTVW